MLNHDPSFYLLDAVAPDQTSHLQPMAHRFFADPPVSSDSYLLEGEQAHHLQNVMRFGVGDQVILFDGSGAEFMTVIVATHKKRVELKIISKTMSEEIQPLVVIAVALPKGDRQKFLVEKLVELGVDAMVPLHSARGVALPNEKAIARLDKQVIEASKQCRRNRLMKIRTAQSVESVCRSFADHVRLLADPTADQSLHNVSCTHQTKVVVAVGPEGGFDEQERRMLIENGWKTVRIGNTILRIETAAIASAAILATRTDSMLK